MSKPDTLGEPNYLRNMLFIDMTASSDGGNGWPREVDKEQIKMIWYKLPSLGACVFCPSALMKRDRKVLCACPWQMYPVIKEINWLRMGPMPYTDYWKEELVNNLRLLSWGPVDGWCYFVVRHDVSIVERQPSNYRAWKETCPLDWLRCRNRLPNFDDSKLLN